MRRKATALALTFGATVFIAVAFVVVRAAAVAGRAHQGSALGRVGVGIVRWVLLLAAMYLGLAVLYRYGPDHDAAKWRWVSPAPRWRP